MWLKLGDTEIINMDFVSTIRKSQSGFSIEIVYNDLNNIKSLSFPTAESRDKAFKSIAENLSRTRLLFE